MQIELKHLQQRVGITFIYVTHDQEEALTISDRIAVMHDGRSSGRPDGGVQRPATRFVAGVHRESNFIAGGGRAERETVQVAVGADRVLAALLTTSPRAARDADGAPGSYTSCAPSRPGNTLLGEVRERTSADTLRGGPADRGRWWRGCRTTAASGGAFARRPGQGRLGRRGRAAAGGLA